MYEFFVSFPEGLVLILEILDGGHEISCGIIADLALLLAVRIVEVVTVEVLALPSPDLFRKFGWRVVVFAGLELVIGVPEEGLLH